MPDLTGERFTGGAGINSGQGKPIYGLDGRDDRQTS